MNNQIDPISFIRMIKSGQNPQQLMLNYLESQMQGSPMGANLLNLAKNNKTAEIEQIARNIYKNQGLDYDKEFNSFKQMLGIK